MPDSLWKASPWACSDHRKNSRQSNSCRIQSQPSLGPKLAWWTSRACQICRTDKLPLARKGENFEENSLPTNPLRLAL